MKIYLIRHGQTEQNAKKLHQYSHDPLSEEGIKQAQLLANRLLNFKIDAILSSPFERTKQTAEIIGQKLNKNIEYCECLREIKRPSEIEGKPIQDEEVLKIKNLIEHNSYDPSFRYSDEETFFNFKQRAIDVLQMLSERKEESILISTHGQMITMIFCVAVFGDQLTANEYQNLKSVLRLHNSGITVFNYLNDKWNLITWNDIEHL